MTHTILFNDGSELGGVFDYSYSSKDDKYEVEMDDLRRYRIPKSLIKQII